MVERHRKTGLNALPAPVFHADFAGALFARGCSPSLWAFRSIGPPFMASEVPSLSSKHARARAIRVGLRG